jgi:two-component system, LuxR family, sensor kinase FixL
LQASEAQLRISEQRTSLAAIAAQLRLWEWDIVHDEIWSTDKDHRLYGITEPQKISFERFLNIVYEQDRLLFKFAVEKALNGNGNYDSEYRIMMPDGQIRWIHSRGRIEYNGDQPLRMLGVSIDITRRKQAELAVQQQRNELSHLSRVTLLGELSGSLAHELNQPLAAILSNAQAAQRFLARGDADLAEVQDILTDIVAEDRRAGEIIHRLRLLLKNGEVQRLPIDVNELVQDVLKLLHSDLMNHGMTVNADLNQNLATVTGDRVQLLQVMLNLILNACDAMSQNEPDKRQIDIRTELVNDGNAQVSVSDQGPGVSPENMATIFEPFFSTKKQGMGLGLAISRSIITAHDGKLWATNTVGSGASFHFTLPKHTGAIK